MEYRHSLVTRATHAVFGACFLFLALTGTQMFAHVHIIAANVKSLHLGAGFLMIGIGLIYLANGLLTGEFSKLLFGGRDAAGLPAMIAYYLRLRSAPPEYSGYNPLQKLSYTIVLLTMGPLISLTGLAMWGHVGGRAIGLWHLGFALELVAFFFGHMFMVATTGLRKNIAAIVTGWYPAEAPDEPAAYLIETRPAA